MVGVLCVVSVSVQRAPTKAPSTRPGLFILCVRWYLTYKLSYRDLKARYARPVGTSWRVDETYIKIRGQ